MNVHYQLITSAFSTFLTSRFTSTVTLFGTPRISQISKITMPETKPATKCPIPIVDLGPLNIPADLKSFDPSCDLICDDPVVRAIAMEVVKAFTEIGFLYLINHSVSQQSLDEFNEKTGEFFTLSTDIKSKYRHESDADANGWQGQHQEWLDKSKKPDFKEVYNFTPSTIKVWPVEVVGLKEAVMDVFSKSTQLCHVVLKLIGIGLELEDPNYFIKMNGITARPNFTTIRAAYYQPIPKDIAETPGVLRCGEHSDYGSITLLYQDNVGGLEVMNRAGEYAPATPIEGSVLVNIADMMQRWTADKLISTKHRVVIPKEDFEAQHTRRSIAFFAMPDDDAVIRCIDNSDKYAPITPYEYTVEKMAKGRLVGVGKY